MLFILVFMIGAIVNGSKVYDWTDDICQFCVKNKHSRVFIGTDNAYETFDLAKCLVTNYISVQYSTNLTFRNDSYKNLFDDSFLLIYINDYNENPTNLREILHVIHRRQIRSSLLITSGINNNSSRILETEILSGCETFYFYFVPIFNGTTINNTIYRVMRPLKNSANVFIDGINENYNLRGLVLTGEIGGDRRSPYINLDECGSNGKCNSIGGIYADIISFLEKRYNFSVVPYLSGKKPSERNDDGCHNDFEYDFGINYWSHNNRIKIGSNDFVEVENVPYALAFLPHHITDSILLRPFRVRTWIALLVLIAAGILLMSLLDNFIIKLSEKYNELTSYYGEIRRIVLFNSGFFFVLLNAYYYASMVMFETTQVTLPFSNSIQAIRANPTEWKLIILKDSKDFSKTIGDKDYDDIFLQRIDAVVFDSQIGLKTLYHEKAVMFAPYRLLQYALKINRSFEFPREKLFVLKTDILSTSNGFVFPENSALTPIFKRGLFSMKSVGELTRRIRNQMGPDIKYRGSHNMNPLSLYNLQIIFIILALGGSVSLISYWIEQYLCRRLTVILQRRQQQQQQQRRHRHQDINKRRKKKMKLDQNDDEYYLKYDKTTNRFIMSTQNS